MLLEAISNLIKKEFEKVHSFKTNLETIQDVMNVPMEAVFAVAREAGITIRDIQSECIDENSLAVFADAYVRKWKSYFYKMKRHHGQLGIDEELAFEEFQRTFKKPTVSASKAQNWRDIDTDALRQEFYNLVKEKAPQHSPANKSLSELLSDEFLANLADPFAGSRPLKDILITEYDEDVENRKDAKSLLLNKISHSWVFHAKTLLVVKLPDFDRVSSWRQEMQAAHYHIYSDCGKDDHHEDTVDSYYIINSALMMAA